MNPRNIFFRYHGFGGSEFQIWRMLIIRRDITKLTFEIRKLTLDVNKLLRFSLGNGYFNNFF